MLYAQVASTGISSRYAVASNVLVFVKGSPKRATAYCGDVRVLDLFEPEAGAPGAEPTDAELANAGVAALREAADGDDYGERVTAADIDPELLANTV